MRLRRDEPGLGQSAPARAPRFVLVAAFRPLSSFNDGKGGRVSMLLVDERGCALGSRILDRVGRPVSVAGEVFRYDDLLVLHADPSAIERLSE